MSNLSPIVLVAILTVVGGSTAAAQLGTASSAFGSAQSGTESAQSAAPVKVDAGKRTLPILIREGTLLGPVRGRFVVRGQRWSFQAEPQSSADVADHSSLIHDGIARELTPVPDSMLGQRRTTSDNREIATTVGSSSAAPATVVRPPSLDSIIVIENLMLDRIVRAINEDPHDDYWTITARVTEFQDENRLMVLTANRAPRSKP